MGGRRGREEGADTLSCRERGPGVARVGCRCRDAAVGRTVYVATWRYPATARGLFPDGVWVGVGGPRCSSASHRAPSPPASASSKLVTPQKPTGWFPATRAVLGGRLAGKRCPYCCRCTPEAFLHLPGGAPGGPAGHPALHRRQLPALRHRPAPGSRPRTPGLHMGPVRPTLHRPGGPQLPAGGDRGAGAAGRGALRLLGQQQLRHCVLVPAPGRGR